MARIKKSWVYRVTQNETCLFFAHALYDVCVVAREKRSMFGEKWSHQDAASGKTSKYQLFELLLRISS
jgi:hypothetical protein